MTTIRFEHPEALLLLLLIPLLAWLAWRSLRWMERGRMITIIALRGILVAAVAVMLASPQRVRTHDHLTVIGLLDVSGSVRRFADLPDLPDLSVDANLEYLRRWFRAATETRTPDDRFGLVVFDGEALAISPPTRGDYVDSTLDLARVDGTNIEDAIRLALAMFPADAARRIVLLSDGAETSGDALAAARQAAGGGAAMTFIDADDLRVPIDVAPIAYRRAADVEIQSVDAPPAGQPGQTVAVRIVVNAAEPARGLLFLRQEGVFIDLDSGAPGAGRVVDLPAGQSVHIARLTLADTPINRLEAIFEPDNPARDALLENNAAQAFVSTPGRGRTAIVTTLEGPHPLQRALAQADIETEIIAPGGLPLSVLDLQTFDLIILENVAAYELTPEHHAALTNYVNDFGGGLIMTGGERSFGAGGWTGTELASVLPLELNPPRELRLPRAALVLALDKSGSMMQSVAGARATQQEVANEGAALAIESLRADSYIGVVSFDGGAYTTAPIQVNDDPEAIAEKVRAIRPDGATSLRAALSASRQMLSTVDADRKRIVLLTDGRTREDGLPELVEEMAAEGVVVSTIAVGDKADYALLAELAEISGGEFYPVRDPRTLPRVLVDSVQIVNKPLIKEQTFTLERTSSATSLTADLGAAPPLDGLVITAPRPDPTAIIEARHPDGDPLFAHWQAGLGRVAAFTSDAAGQWSDDWIGWPGYQAFWAQTVRTMTRPGGASDAELRTEIVDDELRMVFEVRGDEDLAADPYLDVTATVYAPNEVRRDIRLRQTGAGRFEAVTSARDAGNYIVAVKPRRAGRPLAPVIGGGSRSAGVEYQRTSSDVELLREIAAMTGGRRLEINRPEAADLYDRTGLPRTRSLLPAWRDLVVLAVLLLLLDVASRRIAWSYLAIRERIARAAAMATPSRRGERAGATLAGLRTTNAQVEARMGRDRIEVERPTPRRMKRRAATASERDAALDALSGGRGSSTKAASSEEPNAAPVRDRRASKPPEDEVTPPSSTTEGLFAAKRRARRQLEDED